MKPIPYGKQLITEEDKKAVLETLESDFLTQGPKIAEFEKKFADYTGASYAVAVANGTAALHLAALAMGVKSGTKVITTPITFAASANCVKYCGGQITFVDIDPNTYLIDLNKVEDLLKKTGEGEYSGIIPVDFAGYPVNLQDLRFIAHKYNLWVIEDACHAPGGYFIDSSNHIQNCGNGVYADASIFSFHPVKHIATGEGGMITTNNRQLYEHLTSLRTHGITKEPSKMHHYDGGWYYEMIELGYNYRLSEIQAALGVSQLKRADTGLNTRQKIAQNYFQKLKNLPVKLPAVRNNVLHAWHLFVIQTEKRKQLYEFLKEKHIQTQVHYIPVHYMPYYQELGWRKGDLPVSEEYYEKCISLPMFPALSEDEQEYVIEMIHQFFSEN